MKSGKQVSFIVFILFLFVQNSFAQKEASDTLRITELQPVTVSAYRLEQTDLQTPLAISTVGEYRLQHGQQQLALDEALSAVPGVFVQNADNFSQDIRVSIRGFGARSAFGIRGIKILMDGFPETSPDGQGQVDNIEPGSVNSVNIIRGASSGLYGNSSGGVINFNTLRFSERQFAEANISGGSFGFQKYQLKTGGGKAGKYLYNLSSSFTRTNGYREQSAMKNYLLNGGLMIPLDSASHFLIALNYVNSPLAQDPGGITMEQAMDKPETARDRNIQFDASEKVAQGRAGLAFVKQLSSKDRITARAYFSARNFSNKLPFQNGGIVEFDRNSLGSSFNYLHQGQLFGLPWQLSLGVDAENQSDDRRRFNNLDGIKQDKTLEQEENFASFGIYVVQKFSLGKRLLFSPGFRFDGVRQEAKDKFLSDGDDSGERTVSSFNPILGAVYTLSEGTNFYANVATSFETPTLNELSNNPTGGGFNEDLQPQKAANYEMGIKGFLENTRLRYDLAVFHIRLKDEFSPFELPAFPGRTFYRNASSSKRNGLEAGLGSYLGKGFYAWMNYTFSSFQFIDYETPAGSFDGKTLPGIPRHAGYFELRYFKSKGLYGVFRTQFTGGQFADDGNSVQTEAYWLANARLGYTLKLEKWTVEPSFGINNLFDSFYYSNLRVNAAGARYFETGAGIHFFGGVKVRID